MSSVRRHLRLPAIALALALAAAAPATAQVSGGVAAEPGAGSLQVRPVVLLGRTLHVRGALAPEAAGRTVVVDRQDRHGAWHRVGDAVVKADGAWLVRWRADHVGRFTLRAALDERLRASDASVATTGATAATTVFRPANATWYGPGFFGRTTACGVRLRRSTLGVAHRTLPCGTPVAIAHRGRQMEVPVIDRGPFRRGYSWDLTQAAAEALNFSGTGRIGALRLPRAARR